MNTNKRNLQSAIRNPHSSRQGILLLVVLSMLTLFLLIGTAFIVSANHFRRTMKTGAQVTQTSNSSIDQGRLLDEVINQLVRDTNNQNSTLRFHSLLRDMYGNDGILGEIQATDWAGANQALTGGQMLEFSLNNLKDQFGVPFVAAGGATIRQLSQTNNAYNGLVLTFLSGPARGQSTRIVGYLPGTPSLFRVMTPRLADGSVVTAPGDLNGFRIAINGRPFNGTGAGYDPTNTTLGTAKLSTTELVAGQNPELPLVPNASFIDHEQFNTNGAGNFEAYFSSEWTSLNATERQRLINGMGLVGLGGSDESYDAVDFQNMALGLMPSNPVETTLAPGVAFPLASADVPSDLLGMVLPSLHRPALINYWESRLAGGTDLLPMNPSMLRKVLMRPSWWDHPEFTGSNPDYATQADVFRTEFDLDPTSTATEGASTSLIDRMIYGPWDVDNDNDGVRDSVWVDFGAPVRENSDGKLVKPMAAILVLDMDGRLNLNAHGSEDIAGAEFLNNFGVPIAGAGNTTNLLPQGQGFGPAEISLGPLMPYDSGGSLTRKEQRWKWYKRFSRGVARGHTIVPDVDVNTDIQAVTPIAGDHFLRRQVGKLGQDDGATFVPGEIGFDIGAQLKMQGSPRWANGRLLNSAGAQVLGGYATAPDLYGRYVVGLNDFGQPVSEAISHYNFDNTTRIDQNTPYELDLSLSAARGDSQNAPDGPYTMAEMERILRAYDPDAGALPSRIWKLAGEFKPTSTATTPDLDNLNLWRTTLTTDSYDLPVPSVVVPGWMVETGPDTATTGDEYVVVMGKPAVGASFADLLEYRIRVAENPAITPPKVIWRKVDDTPARIDAIQREMRKLLPPDLADGLRLDINRPLGNGRDDNDNGVVDEPGEIDPGTGEEAPFWASNDPRLDAFTGNDGSNFGQFRDAIDRDGDGTITDFERGDLDSSGSVDTVAERVALHNFRRQMLARDLYVMAMTLVDPFDLTTTEGKAKARQLAQWAINVVDFRDPDNIMTAFEYDENPFDGWEVDGNVTHEDGPDNTPGNTDDDNPMQREVVWGAERPELLITETLAWHDRRTENTKLELNPNTPELASQVKKASSPSDGPEIDSDYDQQERPQGAGFVEIYNPWSKNPAANADTHDTLTTPGTDSGVNLAATDLTGNSPVWRLFVPKFGGPAKDTDDPDSANQPLADANADRSVYFAGFDPGDSAYNALWDDDGVAYFNDLTINPVPPVRPESYIVVGSGRETPAGSGVYLAPFGAQKGQVDESNRGIMLNPNVDPVVSPNVATIEVRDGNGDRVSDIDLGANSVFATAEMSSVAIIDQTQLGQVAGDVIPFSFSEPPGGYRVGGSQYKGLTVIDTPLDDQRFTGLGGGGLGGGLANDLNNADGEIGLMLPRAGAGGGLGGAAGTAFAEKARRTLPGFRWVYLQRLANPLLPWNPEQGKTGHDPAMAVNPYMTIDSMGVNVTVFNGIAEKEEVKDPGDPTQNPLEFDNDTNLTGIGGGAIDTFASLQRGRVNLLDTTIPFGEAALADLQQKTSEENEGLSQPVNPTTLPVQVTASLWGPEILSRDGTNNLGLWENRSGMNGDTLHPGSNSYNLKAVPDCTLGFLNEPFRGNSTDPKRTPEQPFPWITWNNRPFANANEIMQVSAFRSSQMLQAFSMRTPSTDVEAYDGDVEEFAMSASLTLQKDGPYGHLLNFFRTKEGPTTGKEGIVGLHRMLDYVHVPSPFVKTETWLNPANFGNTNVASVNDPRYQRQPPFNRIAEYREPGRVNINTVVSVDVWDGGLLHRELEDPTLPWDPVSNNYDTTTGHAGPLFLDDTETGLVASRRGYGAANMPSLLLDPNTPTFFENPFRSTDAGDLVPLGGLRPDEDVDCGILRQNSFASGVTKPALFAADTADDPDTTEVVENSFQDSDRNPYFRYQPISRLSSMTTTRSNVYAVWVTIGFFEVEEAPDRNTFATNNGFGSGATAVSDSAALYDKVYPDGYAFGKEAGSETGDLRRVREFAMIDRTVPVAFEPGQNHNVDKAIRLRRRIE